VPFAFGEGTKQAEKIINEVWWRSDYAHGLTLMVLQGEVSAYPPVASCCHHPFLPRQGET